MKTNVTIRKAPVYTHGGAISSNISPIQRLRRLTMACLLWEDTFYVDGKTIADQIEEVCTQLDQVQVLNIARECHLKGLLRHVPLLLIVNSFKCKNKLIRTDEFGVTFQGAMDIIADICSRPDQMTELLSLYWKDGKKPIPAQLKKGLAKAFTRFDEYALQKYNRDTPIKLRDVLFLSHAKPKNDEQAELWKRLISNQLKTPETWEVKLSSGEDKKESFSELLAKGKMGKLAIVRNLRNMQESGVDKSLVKDQLLKQKREILPFQFIAASRACPQWEDIIDESMVDSLKDRNKLSDITAIFVDVSGSMTDKISGKSEISRMDAACGIAILLREICESVDTFTFSNQLAFVPPRHGMALRDSIIRSQPNSGTCLGGALNLFLANKKKDLVINRVIVITDEQANDIPPRMLGVERCYIINVGTYEHGIKNNGEWLTINGFSEYVIDYIQEIEKEEVKSNDQ